MVVRGRRTLISVIVLSVNVLHTPDLQLDIAAIFSKRWCCTEYRLQQSSSTTNAIEFRADHMFTLKYALAGGMLWTTPYRELPAGVGQIHAWIWLCRMDPARLGTTFCIAYFTPNACIQAANRSICSTSVCMYFARLLERQISYI